MKLLWHLTVRAGVVSYLWLLKPQKRRVRGLILRDQSVLLVKHVGGRNQWTLPGGGMHADESPEDTLKREIYEELEINVLPVGDVGTVEVNRYGALTTYHILIATTVNRALIPDPVELREARWFDLKALPDDCSEVVRVAASRHIGQNEAAKD